MLLLVLPPDSRRLPNHLRRIESFELSQTTFEQIAHVIKIGKFHYFTYFQFLHIRVQLTFFQMERSHAFSAYFL